MILTDILPKHWSTSSQGSPVNVLHESVRLICKRWASLIRDCRFIKAHLLKSKSGLFIYEQYAPVPPHFLEFNGQDFIIRDVRQWFPGPMVASNDGVALFVDSNDPQLGWVANPVTMQMVPLPGLEETFHSVQRNSHISRIPSTGECKLVHAYEDDFKTLHWLVLTVGADQTWRKLDHEHSFVNGHGDMDKAVCSIGGVVYWPYHNFEMNGTKYFLALDMAEESVYDFAVPSGCIDPRAYLQMGKYLSAFSYKHSSFMVCVSKNWRRGEWCTTYDIDVQISKLNSDKHLLPVAWLNDDEVVIFKGFNHQSFCVWLTMSKKRRRELWI